MMEKRLEQEMAEYIGLTRYKYASERVDYRNGTYVRHLLTEMGDLDLLVPRSRQGGFPIRLFARYCRRCRSVEQVLNSETAIRIRTDFRLISWPQ